MKMSQTLTEILKARLDVDKMLWHLRSPYVLMFHFNPSRIAMLIPSYCYSTCYLLRLPFRHSFIFLSVSLMFFPSFVSSLFSFPFPCVLSLPLFLLSSTFFSMTLTFFPSSGLSFPPKLIVSSFLSLCFNSFVFLVLLPFRPFPLSTLVYHQQPPFFFGPFIFLLCFPLSALSFSLPLFPPALSNSFHVFPQSRSFLLLWG